MINLPSFLSTLLVCIFFSVSTKAQAPLQLDSLVITNVGCDTTSRGSIFSYVSGGVPPYSYSISIFNPLLDDYSEVSTESFVEDVSATGEVFLLVFDSGGTSISFTDEIRYTTENIYTYEFSNGDFAQTYGSNFTTKHYEGSICQGDSLYITIPEDEAFFYGWGNGTSGNVNAVLPDESRIYSTVIAEASGCLYTLTVLVNVLPSDDPDCLTSTLEENTEAAIQFYPNPVNDILTIKGEAERTMEYSIFDSNGKMVQRDVLSDQQVDVSGLCSGFYIIKYGDEGLLGHYSFIKL